jgi:hypothetical protein
LISSAGGGYSINNAARIALNIANIGRRLASEAPLEQPKGGAQFHFALPGGFRGFQPPWGLDMNHAFSANLEQRVDDLDRPGLAIDINGLGRDQDPIEIMTQTFTPKEVLRMKTYELMASRLVCPGQTVVSVPRIRE